MKKLLIIMMLIPVLSWGQIKPYGHIELQNYKIMLSTANKSIPFKTPSISTKLGIKYDYKRLTIATESNVFSNYYSGMNLTPELAFFDFKVEYKISSKIKIKYSHRCIHSITTYSHPQRIKMFGGGDRIGIYFD